MLKLYCKKMRPGVKLCAAALILSVIASLFTAFTLLNTSAEDGKIAAIKIKKVANSPYFTQTLWLEPNTEYELSYMYNGEIPDVDVALKGKNEKNFDRADRVFDKDLNKVTRSFTTCGLDDPDITKGTGANYGKLQAFVGIRIYAANAAAVGSYYTDFKLVKKSDTSKTNLFTDLEFNSFGARDSGYTWNGNPWNTDIKNNFQRVTVDESSFVKQYGVLSVKPGSKFYIGQWKELDNNATYITSFYYSATINPQHVRISKDQTWNNHFTVKSIKYDETHLKATVEFTIKKDSLTFEYAASQGYSGKKILAYVGIQFSASDNGYIYDWQLYKKNDSKKTNLFNDPTFKNLGAESLGGDWYNVDKGNPGSRFGVTSLASIGGMDAFLQPDLSGNGENVLKSNGINNAYITQEVSVVPGKTYYYSYYYSNSSPSSYAIIKNDEYAKGNIPIVKYTEDEEFYKVTVEFTVPEDAAPDPNISGNVLLDFGIRATTGKTQYYYDFRLWAADDAEQRSLILDGDFKYMGYKWQQVYWEESSIFSVVALSSLEEGIDYFRLPDIEDFKKGDGKSYAIKTDGERNPFLFQQVSLDPNKTYAFSFYHINKISQDVYSGEARLFKQLKDKAKLPEEQIISVEDDKEWNKTTTTFMPFKLSDEDVTEDPKNPGNVLMYVGVRCWEEVMYYYGFELYDVDDPNKENILLDLDFNYKGLTWIQMYWTEKDRFIRIPVDELEGGVEYFKKLRGPDIPVAEGPKMMTYGSEGTEGTMYIDLPYTVKKNDSSGKYYIVTVNIRPTEGREPTGFVTSNYSGGYTNVSPISIDGYKYTFYLQERFKSRLGIKIARRTSGYISHLEMYEADNNQNIIGTKNLATAFGKDGTFSDWTIQSGLRWFELSGGAVGTYPGEKPVDYTGRTNGKLVSMPEGYLQLPNPGVWWNPEDDTASETTVSGKVSGKVTSLGGKLLSGVDLKLVPMGEGKTLLGSTDKNGIFSFNKVPVGGYNLYIVEDRGNEIFYSNEIWVETMGDEVKVDLTYDKTVEAVDAVPVTTGAVNGYIVDKNGNPINGLTLLLDSEEIFAVTDENGYFEFKDVAAGIHSVMINRENAGPLVIANIMVNEGVAYRIQTSEGNPLVYDKDAAVASGTSDKQNYKDNKKDTDKSSVPWLLIIVIASAVVLAGGAAIIIIKKRKA